MTKKKEPWIRFDETIRLFLVIFVFLVIVKAFVPG